MDANSACACSAVIPWQTPLKDIICERVHVGTIKMVARERPSKAAQLCCPHKHSCPNPHHDAPMTPGKIFSTVLH